MVAITAKGHTVPTRTDPVDIESTFTAFGDSISDLPPVGSLTEANQLATTGATFPVHVWRTDLHAYHVKETVESDWIQAGGQDFYANANVSRTAQNETVTDLHVNAFGARSEGWALSAGGVVIPQTGLWHVEIYGKIEGITSGTAGRRFFDYKLDSSASVQKFPIVDDSSGGGASVALINAGQTLMFRVFQATGAARIVRADVSLAYIGSPRIIG